MGGSREREEFDTDDMEVALHGAGGDACVGLVDVLKRIPTKHRKAACDAAIEEIDAAERRASLEKALKDKVNAMSTDELERFLNSCA